jgi:hypothetical protein
MSGDRQALVYSMNVEIESDLAMVLPLPVVPGSGDDAVTFVDLSEYPKLFTDLRGAFPEMISYPRSGGILAAAQTRSRPKLEVHDVGAFVASFVPSARDFDRLDERFRLTPEVFDKRERYTDYGFAVFQLKPRKGWFGGSRRQTIHPMAFTFPTRRPRALFYPTLHVHDGYVPERAWFDHSLYCQTDDEVLAQTLPFQRSDKPLGEHIDVDRARGLIQPDRSGFRDVVMYEQRNADRWYDPPICAGAHVLRGSSELFSFTLRATAAYYTEFGTPSARRMHEAARTKLDAIHAGLLEGVRILTSKRRDAWHLVPPSSELEKVWLSNDNVYGSGDLGPLLLDVGSERPIRLQISTRTDDVEPQQVELGFARVPAPEVVAEIRRSLNEIVTRAVA